MKIYTNRQDQSIIVEHKSKLYQYAILAGESPGDAARHVMHRIKKGTAITPAWRFYCNLTPDGLETPADSRLDKIKTENIPTGFPRKDLK